MADVTKILLDESEIPQAWYNLVADLPEPPPPPLHPGTHEPIGPDDFIKDEITIHEIDRIDIQAGSD